MLNRILMLICLLVSVNCLASPKVVVTIKPLHALVAHIMQGVAMPALLLPDNASPHTYALKPSTLKQLQEAQVIMWVGPSLELFMGSALKTLNPKDGIITFIDIPKLALLPQRQGRQWEHHHDQHDHSHHHENDGIDPHFWLSVDNAIIVVDFVEQYLSNIDKQNAPTYQRNAKQLRLSLEELKTKINHELAHVHDKPFLVYHDGYQYFEKEFNLDSVGTFTLNPHLPLSAKALNDVKTLIRQKNVKCVFRETEFNDSAMARLLSDDGVTFAELDPLGARILTSTNAYQEIMIKIALDLKSCLEHE